MSPYSFDDLRRAGIHGIDKAGRPFRGTYNPQYFKDAGLYEPLPEENTSLVDLDGGKDRTDDLSDELTAKLRIDRKNNKDASKYDHHLFLALLEAGLSPADALATFSAFPRASEAQEKHPNVADYLRRTLRKAAAEHGAKKGVHMKNGDRVISLDFGHKPKTKGRVRTKSGIIVERTHLIDGEKQQWLWPSYIPAGTVTVLAGDPGTGKSQVAIDLCSRISRGKVMPQGEKRTSIGSCAIATAEDSTAQTVVPRLKAVEADRNRVIVLYEVEIDGEEKPLSIPRDLERLEQLIVDEGLRLLVIDPMNSFIGKDTDTYKDQDIRLALSPIEKIAERTGCAILLINHLNKKENASMLYRIGGSIGIVGAARSVLGVVKSEQDPEMNILFSLKCNLAKKPPALQYRLKEAGDVSRVEWHGVSSFDPSRLRKGEGGTQKTKECLEFLKEALGSGPALATVLKKDAEAAGIAWDTLRQYKSSLGVTSTKRKDGQWEWIAPKRWPELKSKKRRTE